MAPLAHTVVFTDILNRFSIRNMTQGSLDGHRDSVDLWPSAGQAEDLVAEWQSLWGSQGLPTLRKSPHSLNSWLDFAWERRRSTTHGNLQHTNKHLRNAYLQAGLKQTNKQTSFGL